MGHAMVGERGGGLARPVGACLRVGWLLWQVELGGDPERRAASCSRFRHHAHEHGRANGRGWADASGWLPPRPGSRLGKTRYAYISSSVPSFTRSGLACSACAACVITERRRLSTPARVAPSDRRAS